MRPAAALLAAFLLLPGPVRAKRALTPPAPDFPLDAVWFNAKPLTLERLHDRRVLLVAFFNTANINSMRVLPMLKAWHQHYELGGLMVVGVHTPEYDFQKNPDLVHSELKRLGIRFPVMLDNERRYWRALNNEGWPAFYLINDKGRIAYDHLGEGGYRELEDEMRVALEEAGYKLPEAVAQPAAASAENCGGMSREVDLGKSGARTTGLEHAALTMTHDGDTVSAGQWNAEPAALRLAQKNDDRAAFLRLSYHGAQAFALLGPPPAGPGLFYVRQDNMWLHAGNAGKSIVFDDDGRSYLSVSATEIYHLTQNPDDSTHALVVMPVKAGSAVYGFSFSDHCVPVDLP